MPRDEVSQGTQGDAVVRDRMMAYEMMQQAEAVQQTSHDVQRTIAALQGALGENSILVRSNPPQRKLNEDGTRTFEAHKAHQIVFLAWALKQARVMEGGLCADGMGMGKTHEIISLILALPLVEHRRRQQGRVIPVGRPTLIVAPCTLRKKWRDTLVNELTKLYPSDHDWHVYMFGKILQRFVRAKNANVTPKRHSEETEKSMERPTAIRLDNCPT